MITTRLEGLERMKQARARLVMNQLFFGAAAMSLSFIEDSGCPTAYTDGKIIGFNPDFINSFEDIGHVEFIVAHEAIHCVLAHPLRLRHRDHRLANMAMDYTVNGICKRAGLTLIPDCLYDDKLSAADKSWEMVYELLKEKEEKHGKGPKGGDKGGTGAGKPSDEKGNKGDKGEKEDQDNSPGDSAGASPQDVNEDGAGQGQAPPEPWQFGEVREPKDDAGRELSEAARSELENEWKITAAKALAQARQAGCVPAGIERMVEELSVEKRDIEQALRDFITTVMHGGYTYSKPNKRHIIRDIYLPSIRSKELPKVVMVMDTSGSVTNKQLAYFSAKVNSVLSEFKTTVQILYCDTMVHDGGEFTNDDMPLKLKIMGGGGTDFRPPFRWIEKNDIEPACLIYFTDGECDAFPDEPEYPVLWALYGRERQWPWGEPVYITPE